MSYTSQQTQNQTLNGIISITDGTLTIENGTISNIQGLEVEGNATFNQDVHVRGDAVVDGLLTVGQAQSSYTPVFSNDLVNKTYTDTQDNLRILKSGDAMSGVLNMSSNKITSLSNGTNSTDAVNKSQLDLKADTSYVDSQDNLKVNKAGDILTGELVLNYTSASLNIRSTQENQDVALYLSTPFNNLDIRKTAIIADSRTTYSRSDLHFCLNGSASNTTTVSLLDSKMSILYTGNVGIGTSTPGNLLDVNGGTTIRGSLNMNTTNKIINVASGTSNLDVVNLSQLNGVSSSSALYSQTLSNGVSSTSYIYSNNVSSSSKLYADSVSSGVSSASFIYSNNVSSSSALYTDGVGNSVSSASFIYSNNVSSSSFIFATTQSSLKVSKSGDVMTDYLSLPEVRISSQTTSYNSGTIDNSNRTNTYAVFEPAGTGNDWAFLRQIGGENDIHLSLDFHDDDNDGKFSLRNIVSVANPDTIKPFFTSTPTGTGIFNPNNSTNITKHLNLETNSNGIWLNPYFSNGSYNPLVSAGGKAMIFSNGTKETGDLVIGPWSDFNKGIKIIGSSGNVGIGTTTPSELLDVNGNIKLSGTITRSAWNSGELIRSKIYNQNTDGAGNITIGAATTATWKAITFNIQNPTINQSVLTVEIDCPYIISGNEGDYITVRVFDATDAANNNYQYLVRKTQRFDQDIGGGTRSGPIFPIITSYTPSYALTTYSRSIYIEIANFSDDNVYICHYILNGNVTVQNTYTIKISEYKI